MRGSFFIAEISEGGSTAKRDERAERRQTVKLAVVFPGIGYHTDKPLLYYSKKLAEKYGYETLTVPYGDFPADVKGSAEKMEECFYEALDQAEEQLKDRDFSSCEDLLFISKSVGTAVASAYGQRHHLKTRNLYFTPVEASFQFMDQPGIVFHGTKDGWVKTESVVTGCEKRSLPLFIYENANHSLETGDVQTDLENLKKIMKEAEEYIGC